ncbi:MAG TPA: hypothetical protein VEI01_11070 [Terriglobales bacterium]|nr:hypothetical protein [Terriglobales bacterium]
MAIRTLFNGAKFIGQAKGDRRNYYVFSADDGYLVVAQRSLRNFALTLVQREAPDVITKKFKGKRVTVQTLKSQGHRPDLFGEYFDRLNALYVLVASGRATKLSARSGRAMLFKIKTA